MGSPLPPAPTPPGGSMGPPNGDRTTNLLNLLKFSGSAAQVPQARQEPIPPYHQQAQQLQHHSQSQQLPQQSRETSMSNPLPSHILAPAPSAADPTGLLAALMKGTHDGDDHRHDSAPAAPQPFRASSPSEDTRAYLLNLLNRPKPSQHEQPLLSDAPRPHNRTSQSSDAISEGTRQLPHIARAMGDAGAQGPPVPYMPPTRYDYDQSAVANVGSYSFGASQEPNAASSTAKLLNYHSQHYEDSHASSPQNRTPKSTQGHAAELPVGPPFQILKKQHDSPASSRHSQEPDRFDHDFNATPGSDRLRRKPEHSALSPEQNGHKVHASPRASEPHAGFATSDKHKETVAAAVHDIAEQADREAQEALARAEEERSQPSYLKDLDAMNNAENVEEFEASARNAAKALKRELDRDENSGVLEQIVPADIAQEVRNIVDDAAGQGIVDSWESADQDEIVVIEEVAPAVKVYNFPMKPWISIALQQGTTEPRPEFRDEAIMDIARLKKEFDQIDRNLYTATENYMTYGMSKAGGLRVIRQDDGRDAKVFTDTKDRVFNVAMSVTPPDHPGPHRETIIGTGVNGTVYWMQIRNGDKDYIEDANPEQYGFALPPMSSPEGDAPGGVLKTRARASSMHPDFFAVGRGKCINIIWPQYIISNNLYKPGHDRIVDADALAKRFSLKINTGKAGKDFTFSQDDSMIVSLDKSGRVKFWDVRPLTKAGSAAGEDPDTIRSFLDAQQHLEVNEPIMTLISTPEGEKAWPTSVTLVDKLRPYQKRCALRYMIIGMKQNHTLQLWDLALGKPVQEFNLPHSKESDAVCSVMYHPPTGMIIIGHPTRNSIYFAHLSAPKYNLKSVSQVEYIQKIAAQDSTIPKPDSTAVISGIREYSFDNKGVLRSLDLLSTPAMNQDTSEPTLFELYAMHSKGVACILVKQAELGWSKDNKVLTPVDAEEAGVVAITKLKRPASPDLNQPALSQERSGSQARAAASRSPAKETPLQGPSQDDGSSRKGLESGAAGKPRDAKEDEALAQVFNTDKQAAAAAAAVTAASAGAEKSERKARRKKATAAVVSGESQSNGGSASSPRANAPTPSTTKHEPSKLSTPSSTSSLTSITQESIDSTISTMESRLSASIASTLATSFKNLHGKIDDGLRARDATFEERQLKLLDLVSEVLNDNTQKVLEGIIRDQFNGAVIPAISDVASRAVSDQFSINLNAQIAHSMQKELHKSLPSAAHHALQSPDFIAAVSDRVGTQVAGKVQQEVIATITTRVAPTIGTLAAQACQRVATDLQQHYRGEFDRFNSQRLADSNKIDQLMSLVTRLSDTVSTMAAAQSQFQGEFLKFQQQAMRQVAPAPPVSEQHLHHHHGNPSIHSQLSSQMASQVPSQVPSQVHSQVSSQLHSQPRSQAAYGSMHSPERGSQLSLTYAPSQALSSSRANTEYDVDLEHRIDTIEQAIKVGKLEEAMLRWMQSGREQDVFEKHLYKYSPQILRSLPPLMLLSVAATLAMGLDGALPREKSTWLELALHCLTASRDNMEKDAREVTPRIMNMVTTNVESLFVRINASAPNDPILPNLSQMMTLAKRITEFADNTTHYD